MFFRVMRRLENLYNMKKCNINAHKCKRCGFCCKNLKRHSVMIFPEDIQNLSKKLVMNEKEFIETYCEYDNILLEDNIIHMCYLKTNHVDCPFLKENLCTVHSQKPIQCKRTPYHFFAFYEIWGYMPCVNKECYPEGNSYRDDMALMEKLMKEMSQI